MKSLPACCLALALALALPASALAQCSSTTVEGTQTWEYDPGLNSYLPIPIQIAQAVLRSCPEARISFFGQSLSANFSQGSSNGALNLIRSGAGATNSVVKWYYGDPPVPTVSFGNCPWFTDEEAIAEAKGSHSLYSFHIGSGYFKQRAEGTFTACDTVNVSSPVAATLEVPVTIHGDVLAAESFGDQPTTVARARLQVMGTVAGQAVGPFLVQVESVSVIPTQDSINQTILVPIPVGAGSTTITYDLSGEWFVEANAKGTGLFGSIAGSATALVDFPNTIRVGNFRGVGGAPLPAGVVIESAIDGRVYNANSTGAPLCQAAANSSGSPASIEAVGLPTLASPQLTLSATDCPPGQFGIFAFGGAQTSAPVGNGVLCMAAGPVGLFRLPIEVIDGSGQMQHAVDFVGSAAAAIVAGQTYVFQAWFRDPPAGGSGFNFSDAAAAYFLP